MSSKGHCEEKDTSQTKCLSCPLAPFQMGKSKVSGESEWLVYYQRDISQLGSPEQMQLFPGQWSMRLKADVQI